MNNTALPGPCRQTSTIAGSPVAHRCAGEDGIISIVLVLMTGALLALAGLVWDGGRAITARQQAANLAEQAARSGADAMNIAAIRSAGIDQLDPARAAADACRYVQVAAPDASCRATATPTDVTVVITTRTPTAVLGIVGISRLTTHGHATATFVRGLTGATS